MVRLLKNFFFLKRMRGTRPASRHPRRGAVARNAHKSVAPDGAAAAPRGPGAVPPATPVPPAAPAQRPLAEHVQQRGLAHTGIAQHKNAQRVQIAAALGLRAAVHEWNEGMIW
jgi:hypothetical protein